MGGRSTRFCALVTVLVCLVAAAAVAQEGMIRVEVPVPPELETQAAPAAAADQPTAGAEVPVAVLAVPFPIPGAADAQVPLIVEVSGPALLAGHGEGALDGDVRVVATDAAGKAVAQLVQPFALDGADETLQQTGLKLYATLRLAPGDYRLKATATNAKTGAAGSWEGSLRVPAFAAGALALSTPLFPESAERWRVFQQSDSAHAALGYPFLGAAGDAFLPAASPRVGRDGGLLHVYLYGAEGTPQRFEARLVGSDGQEARVPLEVVALAPGPVPGSRKVALRLGDALPPPGAYRLDLLVAGAWGTGTTRTPVSVVAERIAAPTALSVVTQTVEPAAPAEPPAFEEDTTPVVPARDWTAQALTDRYRELLVRATSEDFELAARELAETELSATADHTHGQITALRRVQEGVLGRAEASGRDALLPVIYLHYLEDLELVRRGDGWMLAQNRHWIRTLVQRWAGNDPEARRAGARLLATVGLVPAALELDPTNDLALLRQAISSEKFGRFEHAQHWLDQLLAAHPDHRHAHLRRGVVLRRLGRGPQAAAELEVIARDESAPHWMAVLATQELAELRRQAGARGPAEDALREGIERLDAQELYLQLAFYLDEWQRPDEAVSVLNRMPPHAAESAARHVYNEPPEAELATARGLLEAALPQAVPQLRVALASAATAEVTR